MATFISDSFTDTSGTALEAHVGETGAVWTEHPSFTVGSAVISSANRMRYATTSTTCYFASGVPASAEYDVLVDLRVLSNTGRQGVIGRCDPLADTMYLARYDQGTTRWDLMKIVAGAATTLGSFTQTLTVGQTYALKLEIRNATKKLYVNGVERVSSTDNAITGAGRAGIRGNTGTDSTAYHLDNLSASDPAATTFTGTAAQTLPVLTQAAAGTHTAPVFTGSSAQALPALTQAAAGTHAAPVFTGTAAQVLPALQQGAVGTVTDPPGGVAAQTLPALTQAATGTHVVPTFTATAVQALPALGQVTAGTTQPPTFTASSAQTFAAVIQSATGTVTAPIWTGAAAQSLSALTQTATGGHAPPVFTAVIGQALPTLVQFASDAATSAAFSRRVGALDIDQQGVVQVGVLQTGA